MDFDLSGKVAAVTGATSGIGAATAELLAQAGAAVSLAGRRADRLDELAQRIEGAGGRALAVPTDVTQEAEARAFVDTTHSQLGGLDILVNNAGVMLLGPVQDADVDEWRRMVEVNLLGVLYCTHAALPRMRDGGGGDIVNVSSTAGRQANLGSAVYNMTKWGVNGFSEGLRQEALHVGVRVSLVEPGMVETELLEHNRNPVVLEAAEKMREQIGTPLKADDIARTILFIVGQPPHVGVNEVLIRPSRQQR
jgi:NADP-dependent 3-hydroxy acid dehydrogenase YdfG